MKKQYLILFLVVFSLGIIITYPSFVNSHSLDSYCTIHNGFSNTALWFLQNGRLFSALAFYLFGFTGFPFDSLSFISSFFTNVFLGITVVTLYNTLQNNLNLKGNIKKSILIISLLTLFYNPLFTEVLVLDESFVIALGILLMSLSVCKICKGGILNYILSLVLMILAVSCYQGAIVYMFPLLILIMFTNKEITISCSLKRIGIGLLVYGISFVANFGIISMVSSILNESLPKTVQLNIFENLSLVFGNLIPNAFKYLFGFINTKIYYLLVLVVLALIIYKIVKSDNKKRNIYFLIILVLASIFSSFVPNLFMGNGGYTAARMALILGCLPSVLLIYLIVFEIKYDYILLILSLIVMAFFAHSIHQNTMINFKRYKEDVKYIKSISQRITWYENESGNTVKEVYIAKDSDVAYYYSFGNNNGANIRLLAIDWAMECAFPVYTENKYKYKQMSEEDYDKYFKGKNYDEFDKEQLVFDNDKLYLLLY